MKRFLVVFIILFFSQRCDTAFDITIPYILTFPIEPAPMDTIIQVAIVEISIDNLKQDIEFEWQVTDRDNNQLNILTSNKDTMKWIAPFEGDYLVKAIGSADNKRAVATAQVHVEKNVSFYKRAIVGKWIGTAETPWIPVYPVEIAFYEDGIYSAESTDSISPAFYYGVDWDSDKKKYSINSMDESGANGKIIILFSTGTTNEDELKSINITEQNTKLTFDFYHRLVYGPIKYNLERQ